MNTLDTTDVTKDKVVTGVRLLGPEHWLAMSRLRAANKTHAGASVSKFTTSPILHIDRMYQRKPNVAMGYFKDQKLTAFICAGGQPKFWILDLMVASGEPRELQWCLAHCLRYYESFGIRQFYYAFPQKWARAYSSFWKDGIPGLREYAIEDVAVLEANKIPRDKWVWDSVLHNIVVPVSFLLRRSYVP